jgi:hypothetical protein
VYFPAKKHKWDGKVEVVCGWLDGIIAAVNPKNVVIEFPKVWDRSYKSMAAMRRGDLFKLVYLIGGMGEIVRRHECNLPILITPDEWKGQLPKAVVIRRIIRRIKKTLPGMGPIKDHQADAIGMGLAAMGLL